MIMMIMKIIIPNTNEINDGNNDGNPNNDCSVVSILILIWVTILRLSQPDSLIKRSSPISLSISFWYSSS